MKPITIRVVLSLVVPASCYIKQVDVNNVFLHGHLQEMIHLTQPPGFVNILYPDVVCLLKKALYGLKQAPRAWYYKLSSCLLELGFQSSKFGSSFFIFKSASVSLLALLYMVDLIFIASSLEAIDDLIHTLLRHFPLKDLEALNSFSGISIACAFAGLHLSPSR